MLVTTCALGAADERAAFWGFWCGMEGSNLRLARWTGGWAQFLR